MATARFIVNTALQKLGVLGAGREARTADATDALAALQGLYGSWIAAGAFGRIEDVVPVGTSYTARGNERIYRTSQSVMEVTLPTLVSGGVRDDYGHRSRGYYGTLVTVTTAPDGDTIVEVQPDQPTACVEPPRDGAVVIITSEDTGLSATWIYDGTGKRWERIDLLDLASEAPRSAADPQGLAALLAMEIADSYGDAAVIGPATSRQAARFIAAMTQRFGMRREETAGVYV